MTLIFRPLTYVLALLLLVAVAPSRSFAGEPPVARQWLTPPKLGGHLGLGTAIFTVGTPPANVFGRDSLPLALVTGVNFGLTARLSLDFEFIVVGNFRHATNAVSSTTFVLDPGVIYNFGPLFSGIRLAMRVPAPRGGAELGFIPIIGHAFAIGRGLAYYVELDFPMFFYTPAAFTFTMFFQTGLGF